MTTQNTTSPQLPLDIPVSDMATLLQSNPLFAETDLVALKKLLDRGRILALRPGDALLRQGAASDAAYIVIEGSASIRIETSYGSVDLSVVSAPHLSVRSGSSPEFHAPRPSWPRRRCVFSALAAAICKNSAAKTRDFLPR
jgi:hypothetical protein